MNKTIEKVEYLYTLKINFAQLQRACSFLGMFRFEMFEINTAKIVSFQCSWVEITPLIESII